MWIQENIKYLRAYEQNSNRGNDKVGFRFKKVLTLKNVRLDSINNDDNNNN